MKSLALLFIVHLYHLI